MKHITIVNLRLLVLVLIAAIAYGVVAAHSNPNVVLVDGTETWEFVAPKGSERAVVKNTLELTYEATRYGEKIQPAVFYNDIVKLNKAAGKGKPRYESAPSRNVFHDDNRVCYFDIDLQEPGKKKKVSFERTVTDPARLRDELRRAHLNGCAIDDGEIEAGLICIAAPIWDASQKVTAAVSISGPDYRMAEDQTLMMDAVRLAAGNISRLLGFRP